MMTMRAVGSKEVISVKRCVCEGEEAIILYCMCVCVCVRARVCVCVRECLPLSLSLSLCTIIGHVGLVRDAIVNGCAVCWVSF
jgi:hypothetical protein